MRRIRHFGLETDLGWGAARARSRSICDARTAQSCRSLGRLSPRCGFANTDHKTTRPLIEQSDAYLSFKGGGRVWRAKARQELQVVKAHCGCSRGTERKFVWLRSNRQFRKIQQRFRSVQNCQQSTTGRSGNPSPSFTQIMAQQLKDSDMQVPGIDAASSPPVYS